MDILLFLLGLFLFLGSFVYLVITLIKKRFAKKNFLTLIASGFILMIVGLSMGVSSTEQASTPVKETSEEVESAGLTEEEKLAQEEEAIAQKEAEEKAKLEEQKKAEEKAEQEALKKAEEQKLAAAEEMGLVAATISRVVDGDTVELSDGSKVRLIGVNTPESTTRTEEYGKEASDYTKSKLEGKEVWLQKDVSEADRYNRLLRIIWMELPSNVMDENEIKTKMFNADLVLNGYAEPSTYPPDVKYSEQFVKFAREARNQGTGLWAYGESGTTKGDLDQKEVAATKTVEPPKTQETTTTESKPAPACDIKGNQSGIYHVPGSTYYDRTKAEVWFCSVEEAEAAGYRAPKR
ncbi:thermonuclease family protein [Bacillus mesophilum]|nr:thermonuclease family protein [Bacillus mesophilum]